MNAPCMFCYTQTHFISGPNLLHYTQKIILKSAVWNEYKILSVLQMLLFAAHCGAYVLAISIVHQQHLYAHSNWSSELAHANDLIIN